MPATIIKKPDPVNRTFVLSVLVTCIAASMSTFLGYDFTMDSAFFDPAVFLARDTLTMDDLFHVLSGAIQHALLEWTSVIIAMLTAVLSYVHYRTNKDITVPIIGLALLASGFVDVFHTLAATRLIDATASNTDLIPFTWALSRGFHAIILIVGLLLALYFSRGEQLLKKHNFFAVIVIGITFFAVAYAVVHASANSETLPQTQFPDAVITRPYDVFPLVLFLVGVPMFFALFRKQPSLFTWGILLSLVPEITLEIHMAFGSSALFDNHFVVAHFLKIIAYLVPLTGLLLDYSASNHRLSQTKSALTREIETSAATASHLEAVMATVPDGILSVDGDGIIISANTTLQNLFGYKEAELLGQNIEMLIHNDVQAQHIHLLQAYFDEGGTKVMSSGRNVFGIRKNGQSLPIEVALSISQNSGVKHTVATVRDITEKLRAEDIVAQTMEELKHSNKELEKFAYVAAHDLRSPLRGIRDLATWITEDTDTHFSEDSQENMGLLMVRVNRLNDLLSDLLSYSRVGREGNELEAVCLQTVAAEIADLLNPHGVHKISYDGPTETLTTHALPLRQILLNLISNSIKHNDIDETTIAISAHTSDAWLHISVTDNGPGIMPTYQPRVFEMFQTLKSRDEVEGSGMGLAIVRKMAEHFGGSVEMESNPDIARGTTVKFKLPRTEGLQ